MEEYVGMPASHPASFRRWLQRRMADIIRPGRVHYMHGDAAGLDGEGRRYGGLSGGTPFGIRFVGFDKNGHMAAVADLHDSAAVKRVVLDECCHRRQVREGDSPDPASVPPEAITATCPVPTGAAHLICSVSDRPKAEAVRSALEGPLSERCPGLLVLTPPSCANFFDMEPASLFNWGRLEDL